MSTPSKPCRSSSRFSSVRSASSRSARQVLRGTSTTAGICSGHPKHVAGPRGKRLGNAGLPTTRSRTRTCRSRRPSRAATPRSRCCTAWSRRIPRTARVLELGCGAGAHLIGVAAAHPEVRAVGVDLAATAIETAREDAAAAGLENVALRRRRRARADRRPARRVRLRDRARPLRVGGGAGARGGARGLPRAPRAGRHRLRLLQRVPGRAPAQMLREMAHFHARGVADPRARAERARRLFTLLDRFGEADGRTFFAGRAGRGGARADRGAHAGARPRPARSDRTRRCGSRTSRRRPRRTGSPTSATRSPARSREAPWSDAVEAFVEEGAGDDRDRARAVLRPVRAAALPPLAALPRRARADARASTRPRCRGCSSAPDGEPRRAARARCARRSTAPGRCARSRSPSCASARGVPEAELAGALVDGVRRRRRRVPRRPAAGRAVARRAPARERARPQPGEAGRGRHHAAQPDRARQRRADERAAARCSTARATAPRSARRSPARSTGRHSTPRWSGSPSWGCCTSDRSAAGPRISSWKCSKSVSSVSRPCLPYSCATARTRWRIVIARALVGGLEGGGERAVADRAAGELELRRRGSSRSTSSASGASSGSSSRQIRLRSSGSGNGKSITKSSRRTNASSMLLAEVGREDHRARVALHLLQQVGDLDVRVAVVRVGDLGALAEQRVGLVEEQDRVGAVGGVEDAVEVLLGLPDVLGDDRGEVDAEELEAELGGEHLRGHRLAGAGLAREQDLQALGARDGLLVAPVGRARGRGGAGRREIELQQLALAVGQRRGPSTGSAAGAATASSPSREEEAWRAPRSRSAGSGTSAPRARAVMRARPRPPRRSGSARAGTSRPRRAVSVDAGERRPRLPGARRRCGIGASTSSTVRSPSVSAPRARGGEQDHALRVLVDRAQQLAALGRLEPLEPVAAQQPALERAAQRGVGHHLGLVELAHVAQQQRPAGGVATSVSASAPATTSGSLVGAASSRAHLRHGLARARGSRPAARRRRRRPPLSGSSGAPSPSRNAASGSASLAARSPSGVVPSPSTSRIAPRRRSGAVAAEAGEHVGGRDALAGEQLARPAAGWRAGA